MKTDSQLQADVLSELKWWPSIDAAHIGVTAQDGVVSLTGQVANYSEKLAAEDSTKTVYGVKGIANDIQVVVTPSNKATDQDIGTGRAGRPEVGLRSAGRSDKITVTVKQGWVTYGRERRHWQYEKDDG